MWHLDDTIRRDMPRADTFIRHIFYGYLNIVNGEADVVNTNA